MEDQRLTVNTPGAIQTLIMIETIRRADALQEHLSHAGQTIERRDAIFKVLRNLTRDMTLCLDVWNEATADSPD